VIVADNRVDVLSRCVWECEVGFMRVINGDNGVDVPGENNDETSD